MKRKLAILGLTLILVALPLVACGETVTVTPPPETITVTPPEGPLLNVEIGDIGHWHFTAAKLLTFTVTDADDNPVTGLTPTVTIKTPAGSDILEGVVDNDDGSYSVEYTALDLGSGYSVGYSIGITFSYEGTNYSNHWPAEVVRDGNERIFPTLDGTMYAYQVRYALVPGRIASGDEVTIYFEPRRAIQTGDELNIEQPWQNTFNHIIDLENLSVVVEDAAGSVVATLTPTYTGLGMYRVEYTPTSVGEYTVSFLFTDPFNGYTIDKAETSYPLVVGD